MGEENLKLQSMSLTETGTQKIAELHYAASWPVEPNEAYVTIRLPIEDEFPLLPEAATEALKRVRSLAQNEIQRFERMRGPSR
ncbi:MAG: hypothetical protein P8Y71_04885 [Pseudolabrys sp.]|jgi:hypothetical protein